MGALCCCQRMEDVAEFTSPTESLYRHCFCIRCSLHVFGIVYGALFHNSDGHELVAATQTIANASSTSLLGVTTQNTLLDTYRAPQRLPPYDVDPRYIRLLRDRSVSRLEKVGISQLHNEESEPLWPNNGDDAELIINEQRTTGGDYDSEPQEYEADSYGQKQSAIPMGRVESLMWIGEDEDICPTCLDGYMKENPKIGTRCGHHFHLGCIYEWMERSNCCPVCDQEMIFDETS